MARSARGQPVVRLGAVVDVVTVPARSPAEARPGRRATDPAVVRPVPRATRQLRHAIVLGAGHAGRAEPPEVGVRPDQRPAADRTEAHSPSRPGAWVAGAVLVVLVFVLALAARTGAYTTPAPSPAAEATTVAPAPATQAPPTAAPTGTAEEVEAPLPTNPVAGWLALVLVLLVLAVLAVALVRQVVRHLPRRLPDRATGASTAGAAAPRPLTEAVDRALRAVEHPAAREAVVRAWLLLGEAAAAAGSPAHPAETAAEYAERLAAEHRLPRPALYRLAELYRSARFSEHPVEETERDDARRVLTELRTALAAR